MRPTIHPSGPLAPVQTRPLAISFFLCFLSHKGPKLSGYLLVLGSWREICHLVCAEPSDCEAIPTVHHAYQLPAPTAWRHHKAGLHHWMGSRGLEMRPCFQRPQKGVVLEGGCPGNGVDRVAWTGERGVGDAPAPLGSRGYPGEGQTCAVVSSPYCECGVSSCEVTGRQSNE